MTSPVIYTCQEDDAARVRGVQLTLVDPEIVRRQSVVRITEPAIYDKNTPKRDGVYDHRMGVVVRRLACGTCGHMVDSCPGHFGSIELHHPVYHAHYITSVLKVLRCVCYYCSRFLMAPPWPQTPASGEPGGGCERDAAHATATGGGRAALGKARLNAACDAVKRGKARKACWHCAGPQPEYSIAKSSPLVIRANWAGVTFETDADRAAALGEPFSAREAHNILLLVPTDDYVRMGCDPTNSHPSWMIITVLPVPPPIVRPSITETEGSRSRGQDDLTHKLKAIVQANNAVAAHQRASSSLATTSASTANNNNNNNNSSTSSNSSMQALPTAGGATNNSSNNNNSNGSGGNANSSRDKILATPLADLVMALQVEVATYHNNDIRGQKQSTQRSGKPTKGVVERFKGKEGRIRGNCMGKRVNFTARAVISPDPEIDIDEVGVPYEIVKTLTFPERVTPFAMGDLTRRVRAGPDALAGAKTVTDHMRRTLYLEPRGAALAHMGAASEAGGGGGAPIVSTMATGVHVASDGGGVAGAWRVPAGGSVAGADRAPPLQIGWTVERHLRTGDPVVMNRQPSLHMGSMLNHKVVPMPGRTFRLNLAVTGTYNADFDGDEMNLHVPQSEMARAEVAHTMGVALKAVSPQANKPIIGLVMDALVGCGFLTTNDTFMDRGVLMQLVTAMRYDAVGRGSRFRLPPPAIVKAVNRKTGQIAGPLWTGKQMFSLLLPGDVNVERRVRDVDSDADAMLQPVRERDPVSGASVVVGHEPNPYVARSARDERVVVVQAGELLAGSVCKQTVGATTGGLVHVIFKDVSAEGVKRFLSDAQRVANRWLSWRGFSVGIQDCMSDPATRARVDRVVDRAVDHIEDVCHFAAHADDDCNESSSSFSTSSSSSTGRSTTRPATLATSTAIDGSTQSRGRRRRRSDTDDDMDISDDDDDDDDKEIKDVEATSRMLGGRTTTAAPPRKRPHIAEAELETCVSRVANKVLDQAGRIVQAATDVRSNAVRAMATMGSKGSVFNITQMCGCVGQQSNEGQRIHSESGSRTLGCYRHAEAVPPPESRGFVRNSYERGLNSREMFLHMIGGREGLVDTAVKTAETGYIQRRCIKSMESLQIKRGGLVRNANGDIVQFAYGGDGADATYIERVRCREVRMAPDAIRDACRWPRRAREKSPWPPGEIAAAETREAARIIAIRDEVLAMQSSLATMAASGGAGDDQLFVTVHAARLVETVCRREAGRVCARGAISPADLDREVDALCRSILAMAAEADVGASVAAAARDAGLPPLRGTAGLRLVLACELRSRILVGRWAATWSTWEAIRAEIAGDDRRAGRYLRSLVSPGEMVGAIAGQSIGEPGTQMSVVYEERLLLAGPGGGVDISEIGDLVEEAITHANPCLVERDGAHDTTHVDVTARGLTVPAVDEAGTVRWRRLLGVTRHPPNGALVRVTTRSGRSVTATLAKSFLTLREGRVVPIDGKDLVVGDVLPVNRRLPLWDTARVADHRGGRDNDDESETDNDTEAESHNVESNGKSNGGDEAAGVSQPPRSSLFAALRSGCRKRARRCLDAMFAGRGRGIALSADPVETDLVMALASLAGDDRAATVDGARVMLGPAPAPHALVDGSGAGADSHVGDIFWDEIVRLDVVSDHGRDYVYDLTVEHDANFSLLSGLQMRDTLRTFHFAGWGAKNVTLGVPRLREIIDATLNMKRPCVTLHLDRRAPAGCTREAALAVCRQIEHSTLATLVESHTIDAVGVLAPGDVNADDVATTVAAACVVNDDGDDDRAFARACALLFGQPHTRADAPSAADQTATAAAPRETAVGVRPKTKSRGRGTATPSDRTAVQGAAPSAREAEAVAAWRPQCYLVRYVLDRTATVARGLVPADVARRVAEEVGDAGRVSHAEAAMEGWFVEVLLQDTSGLLARFRQQLPPRPTPGVAPVPDAGAPGAGDAAAMPPPRPRTRTAKADGGASARSAAAAAACKATPEEAAEAARWERAALAAIQTAFMASVRVSGVPGVTRAMPAEVTRHDGTAPTKTTAADEAPEWGVEVDGNALSELLCVPGVDAARSHTNDINRVAAVLGIEAAVAVLFSEIKAVISFDGTYVNDRHFALATDTMCCRGSVVAVTRHGFNRADHGFLSRASFEETVDILFDAAAFAETDKITDGSVTEPIILGQAAPIGTAISDVLVTDAYAHVWRPPSADALGSDDRALVVTTAGNAGSALRANAIVGDGGGGSGPGPHGNGGGTASDSHNDWSRHGREDDDSSQDGEDDDMDLAEPLVDPCAAADLVPMVQDSVRTDTADGCPRYAPPSPSLFFLD
ncbi:RNA polymerase rbp1 [Pandoravirus salinus]|uniref:DNA-directed RNA polymerase subunit n=1 Tax=Pandoravirus salinus TaxID=1349410 RepID=S4W639_9VIRU|nr:RNA polymerase largest subunit [Pandoravirus salinus]AGO85880.1 RNA polymerase rbp1 [Pandoravirus salinus]